MQHARKDYDERIQDAANLIPVDEPVFLLRGQDPVGWVAVEAWADAAERMGTHRRVLARVRWAKDMREWSQSHGHLPDAPLSELKP